MSNNKTQHNENIMTITPMAAPLFTVELPGLKPEVFPLFLISRFIRQQYCLSY